MFATGLAAGILLDATIIRALIVPAVISLMGRWNWWLPSLARTAAPRGALPAPEGGHRRGRGLSTAVLSSADPHHTAGPAGFSRPGPRASLAP